MRDETVHWTYVVNASVDYLVATLLDNEVHITNDENCASDTTDIPVYL